jgi:hypothetical protein
MTGIAGGTPPGAAAAVCAAGETCAALAVRARGAAEPKAMLITKVAVALIFRNIVHLRRFIVVPRIGHPNR